MSENSYQIKWYQNRKESEKKLKMVITTPVIFFVVGDTVVDSGYLSIYWMSMFSEIT